MQETGTVHKNSSNSSFSYAKKPKIWKLQYIEIGPLNSKDINIVQKFNLTSAMLRYLCVMIYIFPDICTCRECNAHYSSIQYLHTQNWSTRILLQTKQRPCIPTCGYFNSPKVSSVGTFRKFPTKTLPQAQVYFPAPRYFPFSSLK